MTHLSYIHPLATCQSQCISRCKPHENHGCKTGRVRPCKSHDVMTHLSILITLDTCPHYSVVCQWHATSHTQSLSSHSHGPGNPCTLASAPFHSHHPFSAASPQSLRLSPIPPAIPPFHTRQPTSAAFPVITPEPQPPRNTSISLTPAHNHRPGQLHGW